MIQSTLKTYEAFAEQFNPKTPKEEKAKKVALRLAKEIDQLLKKRSTKDTTNQTKAKFLLNKLASATRVFANKTDDQPPSVINYGGLTSEGGATYANAVILSTNHVKGSTPRDRAPIWMNANRRKQKSFFIQGHLLNHNIGGPGLAYNLTPITGNGAGLGGNYANKRHLEKVEKFVKEKVKKEKKVVRYRVDAVYEKHPNRTYQTILRNRIGTANEKTHDKEKLDIMDYEQNHLCTKFVTEWATLKRNDSKWSDEGSAHKDTINNTLPDGNVKLKK